MALYDDSEFILPPLNRFEYEVTPRTPPPGFLLFTIPAFGLNQGNAANDGITLDERVRELVAQLTGNSDSAVVLWCHLNMEGDRLEQEIKVIAVQVKRDRICSGRKRVERILGFINGRVPRVARDCVRKSPALGLTSSTAHTSLRSSITHSRNSISAFAGVIASVKRDPYAWM